jgi:cytoskeleton protein RodZ
MGTLGPLLRDARTALGIDLREAAQQTRISMQYLKALEEENFAKLPGEVFVKGFLKSYSKFLRIDERDVMQKYAELATKKPAPAPAATAQQTPPPSTPPASLPDHPKPVETGHSSKLPIEPFLWGAGIVAILIIFLFMALPSRKNHKKETPPMPAPATSITGTTPATPASGTTATAQKPEKLYLEVLALENTWILVRTDSSPQKKQTLAKGESLTWSADERFILSYGSAGAVKLTLNGKELLVDEPKNAVVRDMTIVSSGIINKKIQGEPGRPKPKSTLTGTAPQQLQRKPGEPKPKSVPTGTEQRGQRKPMESKPTGTSPSSRPVSTLVHKPEPVSREQSTILQPVAPLIR